MKKLLILLLSVLSLTAFAQQKKVAVYVTGNDPINSIMGDHLVDGIAHNGKYIAVERTASFLNELSKEQSYQRTGAVDDNDISRLGKQFGVAYVCVATPFDVWGEKYISARMIDVERAEVIATSSANGKVENSAQFLSVLNTLVNGLLRAFEESKMVDAKKVAVYVTRTGNKDIDIILGDQLVAGFAASGRYLAIERTQGFLNQLSKERSYQETGAVDDLELMRLGKQFGVQYVCVAKTSQLYGDYYIASRLIDVEHGEVVNSYKKDAIQLGSSRQVVSAAKEIASKLSDKTIAEQLKEEEKARQIRDSIAKVEAARQEAARQEAAHQAKIAPYLRQGYVDLGLPSGTLWKNSNEGGEKSHYRISDAHSRFGRHLPTTSQWEELRFECKWYWRGNGYKVKGPNGNYIFLPAAGDRNRAGILYDVGHGFYLAYEDDFELSCYFHFDSDIREIDVDDISHYSLSVRLIQNL